MARINRLNVTDQKFNEATIRSTKPDVGVRLYCAFANGETKDAFILNEGLACDLSNNLVVPDLATRSKVTCQSSNTAQDQILGLANKASM